MIPATTPTFIITLKNAGNYLQDTEKMRVDIRQQDVFITKDMQDLDIDTQTNSIAFTLSQEESARFLYRKGKIQIQVHGLLMDGKTAWKTYVVDTPIERALSKEVIK